MPEFRWIYVVQLIGNSLFLLPLPILLAAIYGTDAELPLSKSLRYEAGLTCLVQVLLTAPRLQAWATEIQRAATNISLFWGTTVSAKLRGWLQTPDSRLLLWDILGIISELAFIFFLVFLFRPAIGSFGPLTRTQPLLRTTAQIAAIVGALALIVNIGQQIYSATEFGSLESDAAWLSTMTQGQFLKECANGLRYLCWAAAPWIIFRSVSRFVSHER